jgi:pimeloyl-ACP methyl ester carboxylesterase
MSAAVGFFRNGLPYNRTGSGPRNLVVFQGMFFENKPMPKYMVSLFNDYRFLEEDYTIYVVTRKPNLPGGYSLKDMSDDYAAMIREEFGGGPIDVIGVSTGGSIVQHFAAEHADLVRKVVIHSAAYTLGEAGREVQMRVAKMAPKGQWRQAYATIMNFMYPNSGAIGKAAFGIMAFILAQAHIMVPKDPSDLIITIEAEDNFNFKDRLPEITVPTLLVAGENDPFYSAALFQETAAGIPNAKLCLYPKMGHPAAGKQFKQDVLAFLRDGYSS